MSKINFYMFLFAINISLLAQETSFNEIVAEVTFVSSQHIYLKYDNVNSLHSGDTLFIKNNLLVEPGFEINFISSKSCAVKNLTSINYKAKDIITIYQRIKISKIEEEAELPVVTEAVPPVKNTESAKSTSIEIQNVKGRIGVSSYSSFSNNSRLHDYQRWRYLFSMDAENLFNSKISFETYTNFSYRADQWSSANSNLWDKLKIYSLSLDYKLSDNLNVSAGRKINNNLSNIGSVDGLRVNMKFRNFSAGLIAGTRPDYQDFGFNTDYVQFGAFISRTDSLLDSPVQNTISVFQQTMKWNTDRRFLYFQHSNSIISNLSLFFTSEIDLYKRENGMAKNIFEMTNLYLSGRYSPGSWINLSASYDIRKNVMYYETYKNIADSLFDAETRQGLRTRINFRPLRFTSISLQYGTRFKSSDKRKSNNYGAFISYSRIPFINASANLDYTYLTTSYVEGAIYGISFGKDLFDGLMNTNIGYKRVEYNYANSSFALNQNIVQFDAGIRIFNRDYLSISYESIFEQKNTSSRIFINITKRF